MKIDSEGYLERQTFAGKNARAKATKRNWWLITGDLICLRPKQAGKEPEEKEE